MSGQKGKSGRPRNQEKKIQLTGSIPEIEAREIQLEAFHLHRSPNNFVGVLLSKGWGLYKKELKFVKNEVGMEDKNKV